MHTSKLLRSGSSRPYGVNAFAKSQYLQPNTSGCFPRFENGGDQFRPVAKLLSKDQTRRIAVNIGKLPESLRETNKMWA